MKACILVFINLFIICCGTAPKMRIIQDTFPLNVQFDKAWPAVIEVFAERNLSISTIEKDSGIIVSEWIVISGDSFYYADCGRGSPFPLDVISVKFNVFLKSITMVSSEIKIYTMFRAGSTKCVSTGTFEKEIFTLIASKTNQ